VGLTGPALAVDAGNSKTDVVVLGADGQVRGTARGGGFHPPVTGVAAAVDSLAATVARAARVAGHEPGEPFAHVSACLANVDLPREERAMREELDARGWGRTTEVLNDTFALLRAGLPDDDPVRHGVAVVCGAGINCVGRAPDGRVHRFAALGRLSGDWGGGGGLCDEALWHAARSADGRGPRTALERALPAHFRLDGMDALIEALHMGDLPGARRLELTPLLFEVAAGGDAVATALVRRLAEEVVALAGVTLEKLGLLKLPTPVLLGGSVLSARHALLDEEVRARLAVRAPRARAQVVTPPPVLGAALLCLDALAAPPVAYAALRGHYA
jgi:N-acetylglucosamine kinase-like BadF-type ATPase